MTKIDSLNATDARMLAGVKKTSAKFFAVAGSAFICMTVAQAEDRSRFATRLDKELFRVVKGSGPTDPIAGAAVAVTVGDRLVYAGAAGCAEFVAGNLRKCARALNATSKLRVASISKMALAMGLEMLVDDGKVELDRDVSVYLGWPLRNPQFPDHPITARQLLSHTSSVRDPEEYWVAAPGRFRSLFEGENKPFAKAAEDADRKPGSWFEYANLNYGILAAVIEGASGMRFDLFMNERLFKPARLDIGYNWSGVSGDARREGAVLPRRGEVGWIPLVDAPEVLVDDLPYFLASDELDRAAYLQSYAPGENPTLFSPQGGLRASVVDLVSIVHRLADDERLSALQWRYDLNSPNGETAMGFYTAFGLGVQIVEEDDDLLKNARLVGHSGDAYGLHSGAWLVRPDGVANSSGEMAFAFVAFGVDESPGKGANPTFNVLEEKLVRLAFQAADEASRDKSGEPLPFDETADAMQEIDAALLAAAANGKPVLVVLGGNWCHDSRGLAQKFATEPLRSIISENFNLVWTDVGFRDKNLEVAQRFGVPRLFGTPTLMILSADGELLNRESVHDWRNAASQDLSDAVKYFRSFAADD